MSNLNNTNADYVIEYYKKLIVPFPRNVNSRGQCAVLIKELDSLIKQLNEVKSVAQKYL